MKKYIPLIALSIIIIIVTVIIVLIINANPRKSQPQIHPHVHPLIFDSDTICEPNNILNMVNLYDIQTNNLTTQNIYNGPGCTNPKKVSSIVNQNLRAISNIKSLSQYYDYTCIFISLLGNLSWSYTPDFGISGLTNPNLQTTVIDNKNIIIKNFNNYGSISSLDFYIKDNNLGTSQKFRIARIITQSRGPAPGPFSEPGVFLSVIPAGISTTNKYSNVYKIRDPPGNPLVPQFIFFGPDVGTPTPQTTYNPNTTPIPDNDVQWTYPEPPVDCPDISRILIEDNDFIIPNSNTLRPTLEEMEIFINTGVQQMKSELKDPSGPLPECFNWRTHAPDKIETSRNQSKCGGCWAFSVISVLGDRFAIKNNIQAPYPSVAWLLSACSGPLRSCNNNQGCLGSTMQSAISFLEQGYYTKLERCWPFNIITNPYGGPPNEQYIAPDYLGNLQNSCYDCVNNNLKDIKFSIKRNSHFTIGSKCKSAGQYTKQEVLSIIEQIKREIYTNGPVVSSMCISPEFNNFWLTLTKATEDDKKNMIYEGRYDSRQFLHGISIIGWIKDTWIVRNSWSDKQGYNGCFRIRMSKFENQRTWSLVDIPVCAADGGTYGGVIGFTPEDMPNLQQYIQQGIFKRSLNKKSLKNDYDTCESESVTISPITTPSPCKNIGCGCPRNDPCSANCTYMTIYDSIPNQTKWVLDLSIGERILNLITIDIGDKSFPGQSTLNSSYNINKAVMTYAYKGTRQPDFDRFGDIYFTNSNMDQPYGLIDGYFKFNKENNNYSLIGQENIRIYPQNCYITPIQPPGLITVAPTF